ncbi:MAG: hypothetical protein IKM13_09120 [Clostridia bacterium]|nr:hypothetical protein [Clostridia bacterium]
MKKKQMLVAICLCIAVLLLAGCERAEEVTPESLPVESEELLPESQVEEPESESETQVDTRTFLEKEKENDPIFAWEDPLTEEEYSSYEADYYENSEEWTEEEKKAFEEYNKTRYCRSLAEWNYPLYYYYHSGRSEYDPTRIEGHRDMPDYIKIIGGGLPECFMENAKTRACVIIRPTYQDVITKERVYANEADKKKMEKMGEEPTYDVRRVVMTVDEVLWGELDAESFVYTPSEVETDFLEACEKEDATFVAFLYKTGNVHKVEGVTYTEYSFKGRGLFELRDGKLESFSNIADIAQFDGATPEEMIAELERLIEKYPEVVRLKVAGA